MKKATMLALLLVLLPAALSAQGRRGDGRGQMEMRGRMRMGMDRQAHGDLARSLIERRAEIGLNDEQVARLEELAKTSDETRATLRASVQSRREAGIERQRMSEGQRAAMRQLRERTRESARALSEGIRSTLTEEQWRQVAPRMRDHARRGIRGRGGPGPRPGPRPRIQR